jgi:hypothetical protein
MTEWNNNDWFILGMLTGWFLALLMVKINSTLKTDTECTQDCNQGRNCNCSKK